MDEKVLEQLKNDNPAVRKKAVIALGNSKDRDALKILGDIYREDPDEAVRQVALKAGRYIQRETQNMPVLTPEDLGEIEAVDLKTAARAQGHFHEASKAHLNKDKARALIELTKAIQVNPKLAVDERFAKFASEVTGKPPVEAVRMLRDPALQQDIEKLSKNMERATEQKRRTMTIKRRNNTFRYLVVFGGVLFIICLGLVLSGAFSYMRYTFISYRTQQDAHFLSDSTEYYTIIPDGNPPAEGWTVVVVLHGFGGTGRQMIIPRFVRMAYEQDAVFIMPTYATDPLDVLSDNPNAAVYQTINSTIAAVNKEHKLNRNEIVLYGFSMGGMQALGYYGQFSANVHGVVAESAPYIPEFGGGTYFRPLYIVYGELDSTRDYTQPQVQTLRNLGHTVHYEVVSGNGNRMTGEALDFLEELVTEVHKG